MMSRGLRLCWLCDQAGQLGKSGALGREGWGAGQGYSEAPRW
jgi:hypothetical protein